MTFLSKLVSPISCFVILALIFIALPLETGAETFHRDDEEKCLPKYFSRLKPSEQYSGELLAYLVTVVLGRAGEPRSRDQWRSRALDEPLDFDRIVKAMTEPGGNRRDFMVLDPDILDLSQVLFHYDESLSLYKGDYGVTSVYPAPQILAIRLFLLKKIAFGEKIDLDAFMKRHRKLLDESYQPTSEDLAATGLSATEMAFLRDVFLSQPSFYRYLTSPFLIQALKKTGVLKPGNLTNGIVRSANYDGLKCTFENSDHNNEAIKIAILPSMTKEFIYEKKQAPLSGYGFKPTPLLEQIFAKVKKQILETTKNDLQEIVSKPPYPRLSDTEWMTLWQKISRKYISFCTEDQRPLVIYPENAAKVIGEVCPQADFTLILMGKNVYRAIFFEPSKDLYPAVHRLYIDIMDIEYDQTMEEIEIISRFICSRLKNRINVLMTRMIEPKSGPSSEKLPGFDFF